jgi:hypothetical protein
MKPILPLVFSVSLCSCSTYQLLTVSNTAATQNEQKELLIKNDSIEITYNFNGMNGPMHLHIENKLDQPVSFDWKRSAMIVNNQSVSLLPVYLHGNGTWSGYTRDSTRHATSTYGQLDMNMEFPKDADFIAPHSFVDKTLPGISSQPLAGIPDSAFIIRSFRAANNSTKKGRQAFFTADSSPLVFRNYFSVMVGDTALRPVVIQHTFYVSSLSEVEGAMPELTEDKRGDRFLIVRSQTAGDANTGYVVVDGRPILRTSVKGTANTRPVIRK